MIVVWCSLEMSMRRETGLSPPVNYFYWPFQGGTFLWIICVVCVLCFSCFRACSLLPYGHLLGKGWPLGSCWCYLLYYWYFPMWYPGSGVVLDCIVSWSLPSFLLWWEASNKYQKIDTLNLPQRLLSGYQEQPQCKWSLDCLCNVMGTMVCIETAWRMWPPWLVPMLETSQGL